MTYRNRNVPEIKNISVIAHDNFKEALTEWAEFNRNTLLRHRLYGTGTTGSLLEKN